MEKWLTIKEAVGILGMSERTLRRHLAEGKLKSRLENNRRFVCVNGTTNPSDNGMPAHTVQNDETVNDTANDMPTGIRLDIQPLLDEKDARIGQLETQVERLTQLLAVAHKSVQQVTEQNQLLLEDNRRKKPPFWTRIFRQGKAG